MSALAYLTHCRAGPEGEPGRLQNFVGGRFVEAQSEARIEVRDPARDSVLCSLPRSGAADVEQGVRAARACGWARTSLQERAELLEAVADAVERDREAFALLEAVDTGKPLQLANTVDIPRAIANFRFFAGAIRHQNTACHPDAGVLNYTLRRPVGVFGLITPWNLPLYLLSWKTAPALGMGNAVIAKPSEWTPLTATALAEVFLRLRAPSGCFNLIHGLGPEAGAAMVAHPGIGGISFTGGTDTGRSVAASAAPLFKKLSLELGGKNPSIVFADAPFEQAVSGVARAAFMNQGQVCLCGSRVLVERSLVPRFTDALVEHARSLLPGDPQAPATRFGSLISLEHRAKVERYVQLARDEGGQVLCGGTRPTLERPLDQGAFFLPTVIAGLSPTSRCAQEEIFGPVVTLHPFEGEEEALGLANDVRYGLAASLWTRDLARAHRMAAELESGMVWINTWLLRDLRVPFGGMKDSGVAREGGRHSLEFYSEIRNVCVKL